MSEKQSVYLKYPSSNVRAFITSNRDRSYVILEKFPKITALQLAILENVIEEYDGEQLQPAKITQQEIASKSGKEIRQVKRAIKYWVENKLIKKIGERTGKGKSEYEPNVDLLHDWMFEYWDWYYGKDAPHKQMKTTSNGDLSVTIENNKKQSNGDR
jgi:hypothetical protein